MKKLATFLGVILLSAPLAFCSWTGGDGRKTVTAAGTSEAIVSTNVPFTYVEVCAEADNTGVISVGFSPIAASGTREGIYLNAEDCWSFQFQKHTSGSLSDIKLDTTVNGDGVNYVYVLEL